MSDRARVVLIFAVIGVLAVGGGYYFFKVYQPRQDLKSAQHEITGWEERYQKARDCLLGKSPGSSKTSEALAIREMSPDPWEPGGCTALISKLSRGEAPETGIKAVEDAWSELEKAASKAALAFAKHVSESTTLTVDPLPEALDALDQSRRKLRKSAEMSAGEASGAPLATANVIKLMAGDEGLKVLHVDTIPSAHGIVLFGNTASSYSAQITLTAGKEPKVEKIPLGAVRSVPDSSWGAVTDGGSVLVGAIAPDGKMAPPTALALPAPTVAAVVGTLADGHVVYGNATDLVLARAKDGVVTAGAPEKIEIAQASVDVDGRAAVVWGKEAAMKAVVLGGPTETAPVEIPGVGGSFCLSADRVWSQIGKDAVAFGGGRPSVRTNFVARKHPAEGKVVTYGTAPDPADYRQPILQGCTAEGALFHDRMDPTQLTICSDDCRDVRLPAGAPQFATTTIVGGKLVAIAAHGGVVGLWREGAKPVFYSLPDTTTKPVLAHEWPAMALTDGKVVDVLARGKDSFVVIRFPAS
jgi:hypothetical protein